MTTQKKRKQGENTNKETKQKQTNKQTWTKEIKQAKNKKEDTKQGKRKKERKCFKNHAISFSCDKNGDEILGKVFNLDIILAHFL
jgi:hypothetical protein